MTIPDLAPEPKLAAIIQAGDAGGYSLLTQFGDTVLVGDNQSLLVVLPLRPSPGILLSGQAFRMTNRRHAWTQPDTTTTRS